MDNKKTHITVKSKGFNISEVAIKNPVTTVMLIFTLIVLGLISYGKLSMEMMPNVNIPVVTVLTTYSGASAQEIETLVSRPIEDAVSGINGIDHIRSISRNNLSSVIIEFKLEKDIKDAANEVREKIAMIRATFPEEMEEPTIARVDFDAAPIIDYAISAPYPLDKVTELVRDTIKPQLEQVEGVAAVDIFGGKEREIQVTLEPSLLQKYGLTVPHVSARLKSENLNFPSGSIKTDVYEITMRTMSALTTADQIANLSIQIAGGKTVLIKDLGNVKDGFKEQRNMAWFNGEQAVVIEVQKQSSGNTVKVVKELNKKIAQIKETLPRAMKIEAGFDTSKFVIESIESATEELIIGAVLAILIIFIFLRMVRATLIAAIAIPTSVISTYSMMYWFGFSLNTMTLLALSLVVGILVDDAVVDIENIFRHIQMGKTPYQAAIDATNEIGLAVVSTTLSIVSVFIPVAFMSGIVGQFFRPFGLTVSCAVLISLLVARTLTPTLAAYLLKPGEEKETIKELADTYKGILGWALRHRKTTIFAAILMFVVSLPIAGMLPTGFQPKSDRDEFSVGIQMPAGSTLNQTSAMTDKIAKIIKKDKIIKNILVIAGNSRGKTDVGNLFITAFSKKEGRKESIFDIQKRLQKQTEKIPGCLMTYKETRIVDDGTSYAVNLSLRGDDLTELQIISDKVVKKLHEFSIVTNTNTSTGNPQPELHIILDKSRAASLGITSSTLSAMLRGASFGDIASTMHLPNTNVDIRVRFTDSTRYDLTKLGNLGIPTIQGSMVPLRTIATIKYANGPTDINRYDRQRQITVYANIIPGTPVGEIVKIMEKELKKMNLPTTVNYKFLGEAQHMDEAMTAMVQALLVAIVFIYIILASQFGHFTHPFVIMMALPLSFVGAFLGLFIFNKEISLMSLIGIVMLMGLVTKNSILLVDYTGKLRRAGMERNEALLIAGPVRLRPILMTTIAMIAGMTPIAMGLTPGSDSRSPMAIAVIGGLITSTLLTLVVVPVAYTIMDDIIAWLGRVTGVKIYVPEHEEIVCDDEGICEEGNIDKRE